MSLPLEAVPNFSAGADRDAVDAIGAALDARASILDRHVDDEHNRTVFTIAGAADELIAGLFDATEVAIERIDLREHRGVHPRIGAADVIPIVPLRESARPAAEAAARTLADRLAAELDLPIFLYGELCPEERRPDGARPAFYRRGGLESLRARLGNGELLPDLGPATLHPSAGAAMVGVRMPLIAFNVELDTGDLQIGKEIAALVREAGGGFTGVRALGLPLDARGTVQVSMNIENWQVAPPHTVVAAIELLARERGVEIVRSELVGLMPTGAALAAAGESLSLPDLTSDSLLELRLLEDRVVAAGLGEGA